MLLVMLEQINMNYCDFTHCITEHILYDKNEIELFEVSFVVYSLSCDYHVIS